MFRKNTVLIVGAGASYELDLPTGDDLKTDIANLLNITFPDGWNQETGDHQIAELLRRSATNAGKRDWNYLLYKCWLIRDALPGALSIDNLLDAHANDHEVAYCGKLAIAKSILGAERNSVLFDRDAQSRSTIFQRAAGTWLMPFFQILTENVRKDGLSTLFNNLTIITFNYDRCVEYFLPQAIQSYYGVDQRQADECVGNARVIHPYGQVGLLSPQYHTSNIPFGSDRCDLHAVSQNIRTFSEGLADVALGEKIEKSCGEAEQIIFLGFAYHPINMELLTTEMSSVEKIFGTTLGLSNAAQRVVRATILQTFNKDSPSDAPEPRNERDLDEINLEAIEAEKFLVSYFRGIA